MGSYCSTARHTRVVWPIVIKAENNGPFSEDTLERSPEIDEDGKPNYGGRKRSSADWESKTPVRSYGKIENSSTTNGKAACKAIDLDMIKEDGDHSKCQSGECSPVAKAFEFKRGPMIDGSNPVAEVYECLDLNQGDRLAVKTFRASKEEDFEKVRAYADEIKETVAKLQEAEHENVLKYYGMDLTEAKGLPKELTIDVVMEYASGGSVYDLVVKFSALDERLIRKYTRQILEGLTHLHSQGIIHGNLKSSNVLIDSNGIIKLSDVDGIVGVKSILEEKSPYQPQIPNVSTDSVYWTAPEVFVTNTIDVYTDLWSVGCIVLEMLTGSPPWGMMTADEAYKKLIAGEPIELPTDDVSENCRDFLEKIFKHNPKDRPSSFDMIDHYFIYDKNHDNSSVMETLQTLQSFSLPNRQGNMFQSGSLTSMNLQNDLSSNEIAPRNGMNVSNRTKSPEKDVHRRESKDQTRRESAMKQSVLSRVFETNTEEETSPIERRDRFGNKIVQKGRYFNKAPTIEEKNLPPNNNNNNSKKVPPNPAVVNTKLKKSRTADLMTVKEAIDQEDHAEPKFKTEVDDSKTIQDEKEVRIPFTPIRSSVFKTLKSCDPNNFDLGAEVSQEEVLTPKWETQNGGKTEEQLKEEQRRKFEEELMRQLEQVQSKSMLSQEEIGQSYDGNVKMGSLHSRDVTQQDVTEVLDPEEQRKKIEADIMKQLARIKSKDLGATGIESAPFSESGRSTIILSRPKTKEFGATIGAESVPFTDSKNNSTVMKLESLNNTEKDERRRRMEQRSGQVDRTPNMDALLVDFLQTPDDTRSVIKLESFINSRDFDYKAVKSSDNLHLQRGNTRGRGEDREVNRTKEMSLPFSESKMQQESIIQNLKESESPQLTSQEKRRLFEEDILKQLQRINTEDLSFSGDASGNSLSKQPSKKENMTIDNSPVEGADFGDLNDSPKFKTFKKQLDDLEQ